MSSAVLFCLGNYPPFEEGLFNSALIPCSLSLPVPTLIFLSHRVVSSCEEVATTLWTKGVGGE